MARDTWNAKIQLCWWHLRRAVRTRLAKKKLATTPYNVTRACEEFTFINPLFVPYSPPDPDDYEGGLPDESELPTLVEPVIGTRGVNSLFIRIPPPASAASPEIPSPAEPVVAEHVSEHERHDVDTHSSAHPRLTIRIPSRDSADTPPKRTNSAIPAAETTTPATRRVFCEPEHHEPIINMMERHFCAHPLIPGFSLPTPAGIKEWAVRKMYNYCVEHDLREVWAYLWENWYRKGRWELWARAPHPLIPRLKTTMMMESQ